MPQPGPAEFAPAVTIARWQCDAGADGPPSRPPHALAVPVSILIVSVAAERSWARNSPAGSPVSEGVRPRGG